MNTQIRLKLSIMMFVQFFIWGSWYVTMGTYLLQNLKFTGTQVALAYTCTAWAAIISPFFIGMIADRFFSAQKVLAVMHIIGGVALLLTTRVETSGIFFVLLMLHTLCYMPTLALVNAISMNQMTDPGKEFPGIRVLGTIGWIVAGLTILVLNKYVYTETNVEATVTPFWLGVGASAILAVYSFFLPDTPPKSTGQKVTIGDIIGVKALTLLKEPSFAIFLAASVLICIPLSFYYNFTNPFLNEVGMQGAAGKMTLGQASEFFFLLVMPFFFKRLGVKWMLFVGMLAWATRYALFAFGNNETLVFMLYGGIILHGVCFDFFFVTGQIYVDQKAPKEIQANAQGFIALATYGVGMLIGTYISGWIVDKFVSGTGIIGGQEVALHNWKNIWLVPCVMAVVIIIAFVALFHEKKQAEPTETVTETTPEPPAE